MCNTNNVFYHSHTTINNAKNLTHISYDDKLFKLNYDQSDKQSIRSFSLFCHQDASLLWGEFDSSQIKEGYIIGSVSEDGRVECLYRYVTIDNISHMGNCNITPKFGSDGLLELSCFCSDLEKKYVSILLPLKEVAL